MRQLDDAECGQREFQQGFAVVGAETSAALKGGFFAFLLEMPAADAAAVEKMQALVVRQIVGALRRAVLNEVAGGGAGEHFLLRHGAGDQAVALGRIAVTQGEVVAV